MNKYVHLELIHISNICTGTSDMQSLQQLLYVRKKELSGTIGEGTYFSDLFVQFVEEGFSGGLLVWAGETETEARIYFSKGRPFHCSGTFYEGNRIGEILKKLGMVNSDDVDLALRVQELSEEKKTELIGSLLKREAFLSEDALEAGLQIQTKKRIMECGISTGMWHGLSSKRSDIVKKVAVIDPWQVIAPELKPLVAQRAT